MVGVEGNGVTGGASGARGGESSGVETLALTDAHMSVHNEQQMLIEDLELKKRANALVIPTDDEHVKARLEELGEPIIFFAETRPMRRQRLRLELAKRHLTEGMPKAIRDLGAVAIDADDTEQGPKRPFSTPGLSELKEARVVVLRDSIERSRRRLHSLRIRDEILSKDTDAQWHARLASEDVTFFKPLQTLLPSISVVGDSRPLTSIGFNDDGTQLATSSWDPTCKIWNAATGTELISLKGHTERVIDITFAPNSSHSRVQLASAGTDKTIRLWNSTMSTPLATLRGHEDRVNIVAWHPSGAYLFASSHDCTWSMWDVAMERQLLKQDGHSRPVFGLAIHPDGGIVATGSTDASVRVWDVRSGEVLHTFVGHVRQVLAADWHPDGILLATASEDHSAKIYDFRMRKILYSIPAHSGLVTDIRFAPHHGKYLVTSGNDNVARVWRSDDFSLLCSLSGHESKVTALDISPIASPSYLDSIRNPTNTETEIPPVCIATAGYDRTWKLWSPS